MHINEMSLKKRDFELILTFSKISSMYHLSFTQSDKVVFELKFDRKIDVKRFCTANKLKIKYDLSIKY